MFTAISATSGYLVYRYFSKAFPIVNLNLTMDRPEALKKGTQIAKQFDLGTSDAQEATMFQVDELVKTFIELEGGGKKAFTAMMEQKLYQPYTWQVRRFKQFEPNQSIVRFSPDGTPYGFIETISENSPGAKLSSSQAESTLQDAKGYTLNSSL